MTAETFANTLFIVAETAHLRVRNSILEVYAEKTLQARVPLHHLHAIALFGSATITSDAIRLCHEAAISITFLAPNGRLRARVDAPRSGNVLLRRQQYRMADDPAASLHIARHLVLGKLGNSRQLLLRAAREAPADSPARASLRAAADAVRAHILGASAASHPDELRGQEGRGARIYFSSFNQMIRRPAFRMAARSRRPPRDPLNAALSFTYALLLNDAIAALVTAGLDPDVGFYHRDRPGRPGLALDLVEEFRPLIADRAVLALINRNQLNIEHFEVAEGGGVSLTDAGRKTVIAGYHERRREEVVHPLLKQRAPLGHFPFIQARLLARHIRGELPAYPAVVLR